MFVTCELIVLSFLCFCLYYYDLSCWHIVTDFAAVFTV